MNEEASPAIPDEALEFAAFVLVHCAAIADSNRAGELICPFAVVADSDGRRVIDFESATQDEAVEKGWASLDEAVARGDWWAFGREGIFREPDGAGTDILTVSVWLPGMQTIYSVLQRFGRDENQAIFLVGETDVLEHAADGAKLLKEWNSQALERGIADHPKGERWAEWSAVE